MDKKLTTIKYLIIFFSLFSFNSAFGMQDVAATIAKQENYSGDKISVTASQQEIFLGEEIDLIVKVQLSDPENKLIIYPPKLESLDGVEVNGVTVTSTSSDGQVIQEFTFKLRPSKTGVIKIDPIYINYKDNSDGSENEIKAMGLDITVAEFSVGKMLNRKLDILKRDRGKAIVAGLIVLIIFIILIIAVNKKLGKKKSAVEVRSDASRAKDILLKIQKSKMEGDHKSFFAEVVRLLDLFNEHDDEYDNYLELSKKAQYGSFSFKNKDIQTIYQLMENKYKTRFKSDAKDELSEIEFED